MAYKNTCCNMPNSQSSCYRAVVYFTDKYLNLTHLLLSLHTLTQSEGPTSSMVTVASLLSSRNEWADWFFLVAIVTGIIH